MGTFLSHLWPGSTEHFLELVCRIGLAAILGAAIGWEREVHGRPAGLRTHILIVVGCTLMTLLSISFVADPTRIAAQVVSGIGFLGAGSILRRGGEVKGLTTAASVWIAAAIGIAVGVGGDFYAVAIFATILTLIVLSVVDNVSYRLIGSHHFHDVELVLNDDASLPEILGLLSGAGIEMNGFTKSSADGEVSLTVTVSARDKSHMKEAMLALGQRKDVKSVNRAEA